MFRAIELNKTDALNFKNSILLEADLKSKLGINKFIYFSVFFFFLKMIFSKTAHCDFKFIFYDSND